MTFKPGNRVRVIASKHFDSRYLEGKTGTVRENAGYDSHYECDFLTVVLDGGALLSITADSVERIEDGPLLFGERFVYLPDGTLDIRDDGQESYTA